MIKPVPYNLLPLRDKADLLKSRGVFMECHSADGFEFSLYHLDGQYIEIFYSLACEKIVEIKVVEDLSRLEGYTSCVELESLLSIKY